MNPFLLPHIASIQNRNREPRFVPIANTLDPDQRSTWESRAHYQTRFSIYSDNIDHKGNFLTTFQTTTIQAPLIRQTCFTPWQSVRHFTRNLSTNQVPLVGVSSPTLNLGDAGENDPTKLPSRSFTTHQLGGYNLNVSKQVSSFLWMPLNQSSQVVWPKSLGNL